MNGRGSLDTIQTFTMCGREEGLVCLELHIQLQNILKIFVLKLSNPKQRAGKYLLQKKQAGGT